jgi:hypothetical protein
MLAGHQAGFGYLAMALSGGSHGHGLYVGVSQNFLQTRGGVHLVFFGTRGKPVWVYIANSNQVALRQAGEVTDEIRAPVAGAYYSKPSAHGS